MDRYGANILFFSEKRLAILVVLFYNFEYKHQTLVKA